MTKDMLEIRKLENHSKRSKSGLFWQEYNFNITDEKAEGILVQKIETTCETTPSDFITTLSSRKELQHEYFEYFRISCIRNENRGRCAKLRCNDRWSYWVDGLYGLTTDCKEKFGTKGVVRKKGTIFYVQESHNRYQEIIDTFKEKVGYAGELPAKWEIGYQDELGEGLTNDFKHEWDLSEDALCLEAIREIFDGNGVFESVSALKGTPIEYVLYELLRS